MFIISEEILVSMFFEAQGFAFFLLITLRVKFLPKLNLRLLRYLGLISSKISLYYQIQSKNLTEKPWQILLVYYNISNKIMTLVTHKKI